MDAKESDHSDLVDIYIYIYPFMVASSQCSVGPYIYMYVYMIVWVTENVVLLLII